MAGAPENHEAESRWLSAFCRFTAGQMGQGSEAARTLNAPPSW